jgi:hypothetical protein
MKNTFERDLIWIKNQAHRGGADRLRGRRTFFFFFFEPVFNQISTLFHYSIEDRDLIILGP